nr:hypothetical protein [Streptomyces sp. SID7909]
MPAVEQRIDPKTQPAYAAGTDPAYIPGLTAPRPAEAVEEEPEKETTEEPAVADAVPEPADEAPVAQEDEEDEQEKSDEEASEGPSFEVSDRRGSISAGPGGVRFTLDDQQADFGWDEIGAVELKPARFGRRFTVTVHLSSQRWFNGEVEAPSRGSLKEWTEGFDAVLDTHFEES